MADIYMEFDDGISVGVDKTIDHIAKTGTEGLVDTYTIFYTDETTDTFQVTNGASGAPGEPGEPGEDGITPEIAVSEITGGHRITITTGTDVQTVDVMNGAQGERGPQGPQGESAPIDKTLTLSDYAADAEAVGEKIAAAEDNIDYSIECIIDGAYRKRTLGKELTWEDGGISGTGATNGNAYSIRTGFLNFDEAKVAVQDTHSAYRCTFYAYNKTTDACVEYTQKNDITDETVIDLNSAYKYRVVLYNTDQDVRAVADDFIVYDTTVQKLAQIVDVQDDIDYTAEALADGQYKKRIKGKDILWQNGGINSSGAPTDSSYSIRTADFIEVEGDTVIVIDPAVADVYFGLVAYNKSTGAFIESNYVRGITTEKQMAVNPAYKYKIYITDATSTVRPSAATLKLYECRDVIEERKEKVRGMLDKKGGFAKRRPLVTIIDDDGYAVFYDRLFDANGNYLLHAPICTAYEGEMLGSSNFMSVAQLRIVEAAGCEILGHGGTPLAPKILDPEADPITPEEVEADVIANLRPLLNAGFNPVGYCYPYGACNVKAREIIGKYYSYAMTGIRHLPSSSPDYDKLYNFGLIPHYAINRYPLFDSDNHLKSWNDISQVVEDTVDDNGWLILYTHLKKDTGETATATTLNAIIDAIIAAGAEIVTASEAFEIFRNAFQSGDYLGGWNKVNSWGIEYEDHTAADAGSAVSQTGQTDLLLNLSPAESEAY